MNVGTDSLGAVGLGVIVDADAVRDEACRQTVPLIEGHPRAQRVAPPRTLLAALAAHLQELPVHAREGCTKEEEN